MAFYDYICPKCNISIEISKPLSDSSKIELCEKCDTTLQRKYTCPAISVSGGHSPSRSSVSAARAVGVNGGRPADSIDMGGGAYAVPILGKDGKPVRINSLRSVKELPKDMQNLHTKKQEKDRIIREAKNPNRTEI